MNPLSGCLEMSCFFVLVSFFLESCIKRRAEALPPCGEASLFVPTASSLHGRGALWAIPLALGRFCQANTPIVEPLYWTILVITSHHLAIGYLITDAVSRFIWVVSPINLTVGIRFGHYCCLLGNFLYDS